MLAKRITACAVVFTLQTVVVAAVVVFVATDVDADDDLEEVTEKTAEEVTGVAEVPEE